MRRIHLLCSIGAGLCCFAIVIPAVLPAADWFRVLFAPICHQIPERSLWVNGRPLAVCVRCSGFYLGALTGLLVHAIRQIPLHRPMLRWLLVLILCDAINASIGLIPESALFRFASALLFSIVLTPFAVRGLEEALLNLRPASANPGLSPFNFTRKEV
ncbi:MAG TPA: DUF2085 domain-containing protein [Acidobacteriota bacterium]|jgi:uncharacterized membrane protein